MNFKFILYSFLFLTIFSCVSTKEFVYIQDAENINSYSNNEAYELKIKPDDQLVISLNAEEPEAIRQFIPIQTTNLPQAPSNLFMNTYLVDKEGFIDYPVIGKVKALDLTRNQVTSLLVKKLENYIKNPIVNVRVNNFKISVTGEVTRPGTFLINSERISLLEALSQAGDITIYGKRTNILLIREVNGKKVSQRIDITKSDFINSPYYYLTQNDVIYVEPNNTRRNSSVIGPNVSILVSIASITIALLTLLTR